MRVLVTGSSGQLGREIARQLSSESEVLGLDLVAGPRTTHVGSVTDRALVLSLATEVEAIVHTASLHAPHVETHSSDQFDATNVRGTQILLEAAMARRHLRFVYTSSTSVYGDAMVPTDRAVWVTEDLAPQPRDVYDRTKLAAEKLCRELPARMGLAVCCLRVSRLFPEAAELVASYRLHRGVDPRDAAAAHVLALRDHRSGFEIFNISGRSPFVEEDTPMLLDDAPSVISRHHPGVSEAFAARGWRLPSSIDRVYAIGKAVRALRYAPQYGLESLLGGPMRRWLYHLVTAAEDRGDPYVPASLATEGFVHCSYRSEVEASCRYFSPDAELRVFRIDPRRLGVAVEEAETPRGPMPHIHGPIQRSAIISTLALAEVEQAPDRIS